MNKDRMTLISAPAQCKLLKSICPRIRTVCRQNHDRHGRCDSDLPVKVMMGALCHAWRLPTLFYSPAAQLSSVPVISQSFFFFFGGTLQRMRGEYRCCLLADNSSWLRVVSITGYKQIFLITFTFSQLTVSWWRAFPSLSKWVSLLGSMSRVIP